MGIMRVVCLVKVILLLIVYDYFNLYILGCDAGCALCHGVTCTKNCNEGCDDCNSSGVCNSCNSKYAFNSGSKTYVACSDNCYTCDFPDLNTCTSCIDSSREDDGTCVCKGNKYSHFKGGPCDEQCDVRYSKCKDVTG